MDKWYEIRREYYHGKLRKSELCRRYKIHFNTLEKILTHASPPGYCRKKPIEKPVIGPWISRIKQLLEDNKKFPRKQRYTVKKIFAILKSEGFPGSYTSVKDVVREIKAGAPREVFMPLKQPPGFAQVDFGHAKVFINKSITKVALFVISLIHSDAFFVWASPRECTESFLEGHVKAFDFFGFVPREIKYDNTRTAITEIISTRKRKLTKRFQEFASHYLFLPEFCIVRRPNEKGVVENTVGFARRNFLAGMPSFKNFDELNLHLAACCKEDLNRILRGKTLSKTKLLAEDKIASLSLPAEKYDTRKIEYRQATSESLVRFCGNDYSVSIEHAYKEILVKASMFEIEFYAGERFIAAHNRSWETHQEFLKPQHYLQLLKFKPGGFKNGRPFEGWRLPKAFEVLKHKLKSGCDKPDREFVNVLLLLQEYSAGEVALAIEKLSSVKVPTADTIRQHLIPAETPELLTFNLAGRPHLSGVKVAENNLQNYSQLIGLGG